MKDLVHIYFTDMSAIKKIKELQSKIEILKLKRKHAMQRDHVFDADLYDFDIEQCKKEIKKLEQ